MAIGDKITFQAANGKTYKGTIYKILQTAIMVKVGRRQFCVKLTAPV